MNAADVRLRAENIGDGLFSLSVVHLKDGEAGGVLISQLKTEVVGINQDGKKVSGALVVSSEVKPSGENGRPKGGRLTARQLCMIKALREDCFATKRWTITFAEFSDLAVKSGAIEANHRSKRQRIADLRVQLSAKNLIAIDGKAETVTYLDADLFAQE